MDTRNDHTKTDDKWSPGAKSRVRNRDDYSGTYKPYADLYRRHIHTNTAEKCNIFCFIALSLLCPFKLYLYFTFACAVFLRYECDFVVSRVSRFFLSHDVHYLRLLQSIVLRCRQALLQVQLLNDNTHDSWAINYLLTHSLTDDSKNNASDVLRCIMIRYKN